MISYLNKIYNTSPIGIIDRCCQRLIITFKGKPSLIKNLSSIRSLLNNLQYKIDKKFDKKNGTDTSDMIMVGDLDLPAEHNETAIWYEPMSEKTFHRIMHALNIDFKKYEFIDFGSGKGRVLFMASEYGFKKITGLEYSTKLNNITKYNIELFKSKISNIPAIETINTDAQVYEIPEVPLFLFFYSPFKGEVMNRVVKNIVDSHNKCPREILLIFYGKNIETVELMKSSFRNQIELRIPNDWSRINNYRAFLFTV